MEDHALQSETLDCHPSEAARPPGDRNGPKASRCLLSPNVCGAANTASGGVDRCQLRCQHQHQCRYGSSACRQVLNAASLSAMAVSHCPFFFLPPPPLLTPPPCVRVCSLTLPMGSCPAAIAGRMQETDWVAGHRCNAEALRRRSRLLLIVDQPRGSPWCFPARCPRSGEAAPAISEDYLLYTRAKVYIPLRRIYAKIVAKNFMIKVLEANGSREEKSEKDLEKDRYKSRKD